jgi:hypothetical protein
MYAKEGVAPLSEHQVRRLIKGQGVSIKAGSKHAIPMSKEQMKKFQRAKKAGKGMVITLDPYQQKMCGGSVESVFRDMGQWAAPVLNAAQDRAISELRGGSVESVFRDIGQWAAPVLNAAQDRAISELRGGSVESVFRDMGQWAAPVLNAAQDRAIREIRGGMLDSEMFEARPAVMPDYRIPKKSIRPAVIGRGFDAVAFEAALNKGVKDIKKAAKEKKKAMEGSGMKKRGRKRGKGFFEDLGRNITQTFQPVSDVFRPGAEAEQLGREVAKELIYKGIPGATGALAGTAGAMLQPGNPLTPVLFGVAGERAGEELAKEVGRQTGYGMKRRGKGLMSDAFAMAKSQGKRVAKDALGKAKTKVKELVNQYLDLGEKEARDLIGSGAFGGNKKKVGAGMKRRMKGKALLVA